MTDRTEAEEHLRVIRSLMEKATIYRAISAPAALFAGCLASVVGSALIVRYRNTPMEFATFVGCWLGVLALASSANLVFLWREARSRNEAVMSPGMRLALRAMLPSLACGGAVSFYFSADYQLVRSVVLWMVFYGLALLATSHFAPRSITLLGVTFLVAGLFFVKNPLALLALPLPFLHAGFQNNFAALANALMVLSFGAFHLIYAVCVWSRKTQP